MKVVSGLFFVWMLIGCSLTKEKTTNSTSVKLEKADDVHASFVTGKVINRIGEGCSYIQVQEGATLKKYYPINLSDEYKKDGLKIHFLFHLSRAMLPQGCVAEAVDAVIVIDEIELKI